VYYNFGADLHWRTLGNMKKEGTLIKSQYFFLFVSESHGTV